MLRMKKYVHINLSCGYIAGAASYGADFYVRNH